MQTAPVRFSARAHRAMNDASLRAAMAVSRGHFTGARAAAVADYGDFESLRERGKNIRNQSVYQMPELLRQFQDNAEAAGARVLWANDGASARRIITGIARLHNAKVAVKSKSMASEEIGLNAALADAGIEAVESDLGEFIVQLATEPPSHIIAPAMHKTRAEVAKLFAAAGVKADGDDIASLTKAARAYLRAKFFAADIGISGANFLFADNGAVMIVTNEGNGRFVATLPKVRITLAGIDKIVAKFADSTDLLALLTRSATGQKISNYVTVAIGAENNKQGDNQKNNNDKKGEGEGPRHHYIVLLDNGRATMRGGALHEMLRCIRCGACMNHCPVYHAIGGHSYGAVYMGPMGQVLTPALQQGANENDNLDLPHAATMCGACQVACPVKIPLPDLMRELRERQVKENARPFGEKWAVLLWSFIVMHPRLYAFVAAFAARLLRFAGRGGRIRRLPFLPGWFAGRDMATPPGKTLAEMLDKQ